MRALLKQVFSFGLIGFVNVAIDAAVFFTVYHTLTESLVAANVCAWLVAVTCSYFLNSRFTFGKQPRLKDYLFFAATQTGGLVANTTALVVAVKLLAPFVDASAALVLAKIIGIGAGFVVNFTLARFLVFRAPG